MSFGKTHFNSVATDLKENQEWEEGGVIENVKIKYHQKDIQQNLHNPVLVHLLEIIKRFSLYIENCCK